MLSLAAVATSAVAAVTLFTLPPGLTEVSGMAYGASGTLYVHEDSGSDPVVTALTATGAVKARYTLDVQARDWEDMAAGPGGTLLVADIGDNRGTRTLGVLLHRFPEPTGGSRTIDPESIRLNYADRPQDAETLLVHPRTGQTLVVTRSVLGTAVYAAPQPLRAGRLTRVATFRTGGTGTEGGPLASAISQRLVSGGDVSPDGRRIAIRTYTDVYLFAVPGDDLVEAFDDDPVVMPLPRSQQGEGITWTPDGSALVVTGEGSRTPVERVPVPALPARAGAAPTDEAAPASPQDDGTPWWPYAAGGAVVVLVTGAALRRRARR